MDRAWAEARRPGLPWAAGEYELLRDQVRRFVKEEIKPYADRWEEDGFIPRPILRRMGELGFFGIRYPAEYGGSEMDAVASTVFAEELGRSTYGGVAIATLVHTDMASVHVFHDGTKAQRARWMPGIISGEVITAVAITEPDAGSDVKAIRTRARRDGDSYVLDGEKLYITNGVHADLILRRCQDRPVGRSPRDQYVPGREGHTGLQRRPRSSTSTAGVAPIRRSSSSTAAASPPRTSSARRGKASTRSCATSRTSVSFLPPWR